MRLDETTVKRVLAEYDLNSDEKASIYPIMHAFVINFYCDRELRKVCLSATEMGQETMPTVVEAIDPIMGLHDYQVNNIAGDLNLPFMLWSAFRQVIQRIYRCFVAIEAEEMAIAPLVMRADERFYVQRAEVMIDDDALTADVRVRHEFGTKKTKIESLSYIELQGQVAFVGNGAGLLMASMDALRYHSENKVRPSCFLQLSHDVDERVLNDAFELLSTVKAFDSVFLVVHSTRVPCDALARHVLQFYSKYAFRLPLYVRLEGIYADEAYQLLRQANHPNVRAYRTVLEAVEAITRLYMGEDAR